MDKSRWLEAVCRRLREQGASAEHVARMVEELNDHFLDLKEEIMLTETEAVVRMGTAEDIAAATRRPKGRTALAVLLFGISPLVMMIVVAMADLIAFGKMLELFYQADLDDVQLSETAKWALPYAVQWLTIVLPPMILSVGYWQLARWLRFDRRWPMTSLVMMAIIAGLANCQLRFSGDTSRGSLTFGLGIGSWRLGQVLQFALPLAFGCWLMRHKRQINAWAE